MEEYTWETFLRQLVRRGEPRDFRAFLRKFVHLAPEDLDAIATVYPILIVNDMAHAMLVASLQLPPAEAERALTQIANVVARAPFQKGLRKTLNAREREVFQRTVGFIRSTLIPGSHALAATFRAYIRGDYDLEEDPNRLIREASRLVHREGFARVRRRHGRRREISQAALEMVGRAGALGLRGKPLWDRWSEEAAPPVDAWMLIVDTAIHNLSSYEEIFPLPAIEEVRPRWREILQQLKGEQAPPPTTEERKVQAEERTELQPEEVKALLDDLEPFLLGEKLPSAKALATLSRPSEQYGQLLTDLLEHWDRWDFDDLDTVPLLCDFIRLQGYLLPEDPSDAVDALIDIVAGTAGTELDEMAEEASNALALIGEPARTAVLDYLRYSENNAARAELAHAVPEVADGAPEAFAVLAQCFQEIPWDEGRRAVVAALAEFGDERAIPLLEKALQEPGLESWQTSVLQNALEELRGERD